MTNRKIAAVLAFALVLAAQGITKAQNAASSAGGQVTVITGADPSAVQIRSTRFR